MTNADHARTPGAGDYASVNGLEMYYEIHGSGQPLVVLHGAYMTIETMGEIVPSLAESRQVIGVELQGHGHTADIDRPLSYAASSSPATPRRERRRIWRVAHTRGLK